MCCKVSLARCEQGRDNKACVYIALLRLFSRLRPSVYKSLIYLFFIFLNCKSKELLTPRRSLETTPSRSVSAVWNLPFRTYYYMDFNPNCIAFYRLANAFTKAFGLQITNELGITATPIYIFPKGRL